VAAVGASFVAAWSENGFVEEGSAVYGRVFEAAGPIGGEVVLNAEHTDPGSVGIAALGGNEFVVVWDDLAEQTLPQDIVARRFVLVPPGAGCAESSAALCLGAERFRISVEWRDYQGRRGAGHAYPLTGDSGLFWFFSEANLEVLVKVVNAAPDSPGVGPAGDDRRRVHPDGDRHRDREVAELLQSPGEACRGDHRQRRLRDLSVKRPRAVRCGARRRRARRR
jgi:CubicO group peptidase (beta-lactamase class C family)